MRKFLFLLWMCLCGSGLLAQRREIDSLLTVLSELKTKDTTYVNTLNAIAFRYSQIDQQQSIHYINLAISSAKEINYEGGLMRATVIKGSSFLVIGLRDQALSYYLEALSYNSGRYPLEIARLNNNIGEVYRRNGVYDSSLKYLNEALRIAEERLKDQLPVIILSNIGEVYLSMGEIDSAEFYFERTLENAVKSNHVRGQGYGFFGLAECAYSKNEIPKAIELQKKAIDRRLIIDHKRGLIQSYLRLGEYYTSESHADSALFYWKQAEKIGQSFEANDLLDETYNTLYLHYYKRGDIAKAGEYLNKHKNLGDSIRTTEFISNVEKMQSALQGELIIAENELLIQEQREAKVAQDTRITVTGLSLLIILILGLTTYQYRKRQHTLKASAKESTFTNSLLALSRALNNEELNLPDFFEELLTKSRDALNCDRATYWEQKSDVLYLKAINKKEGASKIPVAKFTKEEFPKFFNDFLGRRTVAVSKISEDARLKDIYEEYFKLVGIESILNAPIIVDKNFVGFISFTMMHNRIRKWDMQEQRYVGSLADLIVVAIAKNRGDILALEKESLIQKLRIRNKSLQEFNSVISHNLREPLTQIIGFSEFMQSSDDTSLELTKEIIPKISTASNRIDTVIKELSTILNETDPKPADFRLFPLDKLIKEVLELLKSEIKARNTTIDQHLKVSHVTSYKPFLSDALYHLISNSLKFSDPAKRLHLKIESFEDDLHHLIQISDNGRGMDMKKFGDKIFKMYQRYHMDIEGRGIGLFLVNSRISAINGLIEVESEEGTGTTFRIKLPKNPTRI